MPDSARNEPPTEASPLGYVWPEEGLSRIPDWVYTSERNLRPRDRAHLPRPHLEFRRARSRDPDARRFQALLRRPHAGRGRARPGRRRSMSSRTAARIAAPNSAGPTAARRRSSSALIINGPTTSPAISLACRSAAASRGKAACPPILHARGSRPRAAHGHDAGRRRLRLLRADMEPLEDYLRPGDSRAISTPPSTGARSRFSATTAIRCRPIGRCITRI